MNELAQNIILQGEENRPLPTGVTFRQACKTSEHCFKPVLWIRIGFSADLDPVFYLSPDPDPGSQTKHDHGETLKTHKS
jgi:hypothetical protein